MQSEMRPLGEFVALVSGNTPSKANPAYWGSGTPWVSAKDMADFWIEDAEDHLTDAGVAVASRLVPPGTVLLLARGMTLHKRVPICRVVKASTFNQDVKAVLPKAGLLPRFLPYLLVGNHERLHERVDSAGHGTGRLNTDALLSFPVFVPPRAEQEAIADIGEAIDERLRLLRQTNATLESIAQALFKSWFIDFDPVRAKAEGREPEGMDAATAALFPAEFDESTLGLIPKGWAVTALDAVAKIVKGRSYKSSELADSDTALVTLKSFERGGGFRFDGFKSYTGTYKPDQVLQAGECIVAFTDVTQQAEVIGRTALVLPSRTHSNLVASLDVGIVRPVTEGISPLFLYFVLQGERYVSHIRGFTSGTTVLHLAKDGVPSFRFALPPLATIQAFTSTAMALWERRVHNESMQSELRALRDTLLPRLISGKLRIPEAQAVVEEAIA